MTKFKKIVRIILGIDDTETSDQEIFIKDLYKNQKTMLIEIDKKHSITFVESILKKHDLIDFGLIKNRNLILSTENTNKKEMLKFYDFFESIKNDLGEKVVLLHSNPWIGLFEREKIVFITKKTIKLTDFEINAIAHDVLNAKELFAKNINEEIAYAKT